MKRNLGDLLYHARLKRSLTQGELGNLAGCDRTHISNIETNKPNARPSADLLKQLCAVLDVEYRSAADLLRKTWLEKLDLAPEEQAGPEAPLPAGPEPMAPHRFLVTARASAGDGTVRPVATKKFIECPENPEIIEVQGDSMSPVWLNDQVVIADKDDRKWCTGDLVHVVAGKRRFLKRIHRLPEGKILLSSVKQPDCEPIILEEKDAEIHRIWGAKY